MSLVPRYVCMIVGALISPSALGAVLYDDTRVLSAVASLLAGWIALTRGARLNMRKLSGVPRGAPSLGALTAIISIAIVAFAAHTTIRWFAPSAQTDQTWFVSAWLGCATATSTATLPLFVHRRRRFETVAKLTSSTTKLLEHSSHVSNLIAIMCFGIITCLFQTGCEWNGRSLSPVELGVIAVGLGLSTGAVLSEFIGRADTCADRIIVLLAASSLVSGAALWLGVSTLWVNFALGFLLINTSQSSNRIAHSFRISAPTTSFALAAIAGAMWSPSPWLPTLAATGGILALRTIATFLCPRAVALRTSNVRSDAGRGMLGQDDVAIALAIAMRTTQEGPLIDIGYSAILLSLVVGDIIAPRLLRGLLQDSGDLRCSVPT